MRVVWRRIYGGRTERSQIQSWGGPGVNSGVEMFWVSSGVNLNDFIHCGCCTMLLLQLGGNLKIDHVEKS